QERCDALAVAQLGDRIGALGLLDGAAGRVERGAGRLQEVDRGAGVLRGEVEELVVARGRLLEICAGDCLVAADAAAGEDRDLGAYGQPRGRAEIPQAGNELLREGDPSVLAGERDLRPP